MEKTVKLTAMCVETYINDIREKLKEEDREEEEIAAKLDLIELVVKDLASDYEPKRPKLKTIAVTAVNLSSFTVASAIITALLNSVAPVPKVPFWKIASRIGTFAIANYASERIAANFADTWDSMERDISELRDKIKEAGTKVEEEAEEE